MTVTRRTVAKSAAWSTPVLALAATAPARAASTPCENAGTATFTYTGDVQTWVVPDCISTVTFQVRGGSGGGASTSSSRGLGELVIGTIAVTTGQALTLWVAGAGRAVVGASSVAGGWGFGTGGSVTGIPAGGNLNACSGGGGSAIVLDGTVLAVAGGGGGSGYSISQGSDTNGWEAEGSVASLPGYVAGSGNAGIPGNAGRIQQLYYRDGSTTYAPVAIASPGNGGTLTTGGAAGTGYQKVDSNGGIFSVIGSASGSAGDGPSASGGSGGAGAYWKSDAGWEAAAVAGGGGGGYTGGGGGSAAGLQSSLAGELRAGLTGYGGGGCSYADGSITDVTHAAATATGSGQVTLTFS